MSERKNNDAVDKLLEAYESMIERLHSVLNNAEKKAGPAFTEALTEARERAVELGELTREEADKISRYIDRDMKDAANFIVETRQDFKDWFVFDWKLVEGRLFDLLAGVADQTSLQLRELAEQAKAMNIYHTGEIKGPGTLVCTGRGKELHFKKAGHIPPCAQCKGTEFQRNRNKAV